MAQEMIIERKNKEKNNNIFKQRRANFFFNLQKKCEKGEEVAYLSDTDLPQVANTKFKLEGGFKILNEKKLMDFFGPGTEKEQKRKFGEKMSESKFKNIKGQRKIYCNSTEKFKSGYLLQNNFLKNKKKNDYGKKKQKRKKCRN